MAKDVIKTQVFDSSKMKQQKVNSCFNGRRQQERVFDARDVQAQPGVAEKRGEIQPGGRESGDVRVVDALSRAGGEVREAPSESRRADVLRGKPGFMGRGEIRRDSKDTRNEREEREVVKNKIHVNGIPPEVGEHELGDFFSAFGRVTHVVIIPVYGVGQFGQQRFFPPRLRYGFVTFQREAVVQQILKKEALVLRGYKLLVSPARERRFEVLDRQQSEGKDGDRQGAAPAPGSSRDWLKEQPSWRTMDGQGRAVTEHGRGHAMGKNGRHQGDNTGKPDHAQQQRLDRRSSQQPSHSRPGHLPMECTIAHNTHHQFAGEPMHCPVNQEVFAMAPVHEGTVPGVVNSSAAAPYIFYQQPVHPAAPYLFYHHGPMPVPYYPTMPYHQPADMVPYSPSPQQQSELAPFYVGQPQGEPAQFLPPPAAWQEISYTVPSLPATPIWQPGDSSMQQQYCFYQQQPQLVNYGGAPTAHFDPVLAAEQMPQQHMDNYGQVDATSLSLPIRHFHPEEGEAAGKDRADWEDGGSSKGGWRPRFEPSSA